MPDYMAMYHKLHNALTVVREELRTILAILDEADRRADEIYYAQDRVPEKKPDEE